MLGMLTAFLAGWLMPWKMRSDVALGYELGEFICGEAVNAGQRDAACAGVPSVASASDGRCRARLAQRWLNEAVVQSERHDPMDTRLLAHALQAGISLALSDEARAVSAGRHLGTPGRGSEQRGTASWLARGRAWALLARGEATHAQQLLLESAEALDRAPAYAAELRYEAMRAGRRANELSASLSELSERCDAPLTRAYAAHVQARAHGDLRAMLAASELFATLGANLVASEAAAHAASTFAAEGRQDSARQAAARSRELQPHGQDARPPTIAGVDRADVELTPREAEMVQLAARGLSNAEIAETLVLSTRTVETHIYRAMRKLGISNRRDFRPVSWARLPEDLAAPVRVWTRRELTRRRPGAPPTRLAGKSLGKSFFSSSRPARPAARGRECCARKGLSDPFPDWLPAHAHQ